MARVESMNNDNTLFNILVLAIVAAVILVAATLGYLAITHSINHSTAVKLDCIESNKTYIKMFIQTEHIDIEYCGDVGTLIDLIYQGKARPPADLAPWWNSSWQPIPVEAVDTSWESTA